MAQETGGSPYFGWREKEEIYFRNGWFLIHKEITEKEAIFPLHHLASLEADWPGEDRAIIDKGVELAVLASGVHLCREISEETNVKFATNKIARQSLTIHAHDNSAETQVYKRANKEGGVLFPQREMTGKADR